MDFVEGVPLLDAPLDDESRRDAARLVFRRLVLDPLFSGLPESIFHADPHGGNLMAQTQNHAPLTLVVLDWSQAGRLSAPLRHALIILCLYCVTGDEPSPEILTRLLESNRKSIRIALPQGTADQPGARSFTRGCAILEPPHVVHLAERIGQNCRTKRV
jgi:ABC1 atypical kinase-like domain